MRAYLRAIIHRVVLSESSSHFWRIKLLIRSNTKINLHPFRNSNLKSSKMSSICPNRKLVAKSCNKKWMSYASSKWSSKKCIRQQWISGKLPLKKVLSVVLPCPRVRSILSIEKCRPININCTRKWSILTSLKSKRRMILSSQDLSRLQTETKWWDCTPSSILRELTRA